MTEARTAADWSAMLSAWDPRESDTVFLVQGSSNWFGNDAFAAAMEFEFRLAELVIGSDIRLFRVVPHGIDSRVAGRNLDEYVQNYSTWLESASLWSRWMTGSGSLTQRAITPWEGTDFLRAATMSSLSDDERRLRDRITLGVGMTPLVAEDYTVDIDAADDEPSLLFY